MPRAGRQHERVVAKRRAVIEAKLARLLVDRLDGRQQGRDILAPAKEMPDRPGDLRGRERRRRRLIEQRLKQMVVASIDDRDLDRRAGKPVHGLEPAEPGADHDHMMGGHLPPSIVPDDGLDRMSARKMARASRPRRPIAPLTDRSKF